MKRNLSAFLCLFISILCIFALSSCDEEEIVSSDNSSGITESAEESASSDDSSNITESTEESSTIETESESETESKITSKVTFDSNGGSLVEEQVVENNSRITLPKSPTKEGYTFDGWYVGDEKWSFIRDLVLGDITLSAKWIANENAIIFNANGGTGTMPNMTIATDSQAELTSNAFTKTGYTFIGWATSASGSVLYADEASYTMGTNSSYTLYAVWEANQNTLVFNANGGSGTMQNMTIATDSIVNLTANVFTKPGYTFKGWSTIEDGDAEYVDGADYVMGTNGSYTLYAVWETVSFDIIYKLNGGTNGANPNKYTVEQKITLKSPTRAGYTFGGWYTESSFVNRVTSIVKGTIGAKTLYARWIPKNNTLVFDANGGKGTMQNMVISTDASENLISNAFTKDGYTFKGWATTPSGSVAYSNATSYTMGTNDSYTLYAVWEANKNTLIFDANGGSGTMQNMIISTDSSENLISNSYVKVGYEFIGWSTSQTGDVMYLDNSCYTMGPNSTYTLYARWIPLKYGIDTISTGEVIIRQT